MNLNIKNTILELLKNNPLLSSKEIYNFVENQTSYATVKRNLFNLLNDNLIISIGNSKSRKYKISPFYNIIEQVDVGNYFEKEIDEREIKRNFNFELISDLQSNFNIFTVDELEKLDELHRKFVDNISGLNKNEYLKEFERLAIDLSWKSSQIEGNTYSLLETERLLLEKETAGGKTKDEAVMLLNHKDAIDFILENPDYISELKISNIEDIHSILIKELNVDRNIRKRKVGITGTNYSPLDNEHQIKEALIRMCEVINSKNNIFEKALLTLLLLSYIQPFNDGNKRTARIVSNAILIANGYCPLSFRTVDSIDYKKALLIFYEQNNLSAFKSIFVSQYEFAVNTYF
jgi:Fic family protein